MSVCHLFIRILCSYCFKYCPFPCWQAVKIQHYCITFNFFCRYLSEMVARHLSIRHIHIQNHHFLQFLTYKFISFVTNHLLHHVCPDWKLYAVFLLLTHKTSFAASEQTQTLAKSSYLPTGNTIHLKQFCICLF